MNYALFVVFCFRASARRTGAIHTSLHGQSVFSVQVFSIPVYTCIVMKHLLHSQVSSNFKLSTQQQSLKMMQSSVLKADELVKIKFINRK